MVKSKKTNKSEAAELPTISVREFAGRFSNAVRVSHQPFTWFLGAGCSKSSKILDAGGLTEKWLKELFELQGHPSNDYAEWLSKSFPSYDSRNSAVSYAEVFARRHPSPVERQREIEMICSRGEPAYGYATLAQLLSHPQFGRFCSTVLTTNFDDLVADALYLYGERNARPLVVTHEALARYVRTTSPRPTVVKLHGDAHLDPKSLQPETRILDTGLATQLYPFLQDHALVFVGYGGNDESILKFVQECPVPALAPPIYWVSKRQPPPPISKWLLQRSALRVDHTDFDQLMHLIRGALSIELLDRERWSEIGDNYYQAFDRLRDEIDSITASAEDTEALQAATSEVAKSLPDDWSYTKLAREQAGKDPESEERIYREGLSKFPESFILNANIAICLDNAKKYDDAEKHYRKAIAVSPSRPITLTNFARFIESVRKGVDEARELHKRAVSASPKEAYSLYRYAVFLQGQKDLDGAEAMYLEALEVDEKHTDALSNYARFLYRLRGSMSAADAMFRRAVDSNPSNVSNRQGFAIFLESQGRLDEADQMYSEAEKLDPTNASTLAYYGDFFWRLRKQVDRGEEYFKRSLHIDPNLKYALERYGRLLEEERNDPQEAKKYFERAVVQEAANIVPLNEKNAGL